MSQALEAIVVKDKEIASVKLVGRIEEGVVMPDLDLADVSTVEIDCAGLVSINSIGIRAWMSWISQFENGKIFVIFDGVPASLVHQFNMVDGFLPKGATVTSVFLSHSCDICGFEFQQPIVLVEGRPEPFEIKAVGKCKQGCQFEPDYPLHKYLRFTTPLLK